MSSSNEAETRLNRVQQAAEQNRRTSITHREERFTPPNTGSGANSTAMSSFDVYPTLHNLHQLLAERERHKMASLNRLSQANKVTSTATLDIITGSSSSAVPPPLELNTLLQAAERDISNYQEKLLQMRIAAKQTNNNNTTKTAMPTKEEAAHWKHQQLQRNSHHEALVAKLHSEADQIMSQMQNDAVPNTMTRAPAAPPPVTTHSDVQREALMRWQRTLELYVLAPEAAVLTNYRAVGGGRHMGSMAVQEPNNQQPQQTQLHLMYLLQKLVQHCANEEELYAACNEASAMCTSLVELTAMAVRDDTENAEETEVAHRIYLEAFRAFLEESLASEATSIHESFVANGQAALHIGQQLEMEERKRKQCQVASSLLLQWWTMDQLAEADQKNPLSIVEEMSGSIPPSSCRMDPLFTQPSRSLEAAKALQALRAVSRSRGGGTSSTPASAAMAVVSPVGGTALRFERTSKFIYRTSEALESRLLNNFLELHAKGGACDFTTTAKRPGILLDWAGLRDLVEALKTFDGGRKLTQRYVQQVVTSKFPELFFFSQPKSQHNKNNNKERNSKHNADVDAQEDSSEESSGDEQDFELDLDETRSKLSTLFHRVSEVCTTEFALIAHVFSSADPEQQDTLPFQVARALLHRIINDPKIGLQARINELLETVDRFGDFEGGGRKLDTYVVVHEKAAGLFCLLQDATEINLLPWLSSNSNNNKSSTDANASSNLDLISRSSSSIVANAATTRAASQLLQFLTSQEISLTNHHRRDYLNLELRLLHHNCCSTFENLGAKLVISAISSRKGSQPKPVGAMNNLTPTRDAWDHYQAPILPLDKDHLKRGGYDFILSGPLNPKVMREPLSLAIDSLARARLMFGTDRDATARVILAIYGQMCSFYGDTFAFPVIESLSDLVEVQPPFHAPPLPFNEDAPAHNLGVDPKFWSCIEKVHAAAKSFDRELWAEQRTGSARVWEILTETESYTTMTLAKQMRFRIFREIEERGEASMMRALSAMSAHIQWILIGGENSLVPAGRNILLQNLTHQDKNATAGGPYAIQTGTSLDATNSPAVQALTFCLRAQFYQIQAALTPQSLSTFWEALSRRLYEKLCSRLLQHYFVSTVGAVILNRDVEALRSVAMLSGSDHAHWDVLRELLTLYMTPPNALKSILVGPERDIQSGKGLFNRAGHEKSLVFMSRRSDFRTKSNAGVKTSEWARDLLSDLGFKDPSEKPLDPSLFSAADKKS